MRAHLAGVASLALVVVGSLLPACSLLGLDRLPQASCVPGGDAFCASLNEGVTATGDACRRWQCNEVSMHCEIEPLDMDQDGAPAAMCEPVGVAPDCDDDDDGNAPDAVETCDGTDDDCDDLVDEGTVGMATLVGLRDLPAGTTDLVVGRAPDADALVLGALTGSGQIVVVTDTGSTGLAMAPVRTVAGATLTPRGLTAIEGLGGDRYAVLMEVLGTCRHLMLGELDVTGAVVRVQSAHADAGFPTATGDCTTGSTATSTGALGRDAASGDLLVAYLEGERRECGGTATLPVRVIGAPDGAPAAGTVTSVSLGDSVDPRPPAIVPLGGRAFLVAFPTTGGSIFVHRVTLAVDGTPTATLAHTEAGDAGGLRGDVSLTLGASVGGTTTVALAWAYGCGAMPVGMRLLSVTASAVTAGADVAGTSAFGARAPFVAYQPVLDEWLLGWRVPEALRGARFDAAAMPIGGELALTSATGGFTSSPVLLVAPGRTGAYRLLTARADAGTTAAVAAELGCLPPLASP